MKDKEFLQWLRDRLVDVYHENENITFVHKLDGIIKNYPDDKISEQI